MDSKDRIEVGLSVREKVFFAFSILMGIVYLSIGTAILFIPELLSDYNKILKTGIGCIFIVYSFFRFYRTIKKYKWANEEN